MALERVAKSRQMGFLDRHRVIVPGQYGFRARHLTVMAVLDMVERVRGHGAVEMLLLGSSLISLWGERGTLALLGVI